MVGSRPLAAADLRDPMDAGPEERTSYLHSSQSPGQVLIASAPPSQRPSHGISPLMGQIQGKGEGHSAISTHGLSLFQKRVVPARREGGGQTGPLCGSVGQLSVKPQPAAVAAFE